MAKLLRWVPPYVERLTASFKYEQLDYSIWDLER